MIPSRQLIMIRNMITPTDEVTLDVSLTPASTTHPTLSSFSIPQLITPSAKTRQTVKRPKVDLPTTPVVVGKSEEENKLRTSNASRIVVATSNCNKAENVGREGPRIHVPEQTRVQQHCEFDVVPKTTVTWAGPGSRQWMHHSPPPLSTSMSAPSGVLDKSRNKVSSSRVVRLLHKDHVAHEQGHSRMQARTQAASPHQKTLPDPCDNNGRHLVEMRPGYAHQGRPSPCTVCESTCLLVQIIIGKSMEIGNLVEQLETRPPAKDGSSTQCNPLPSLVQQVTQQVESLRRRVGQLSARMSGHHWHYSTEPPPEHCTPGTSAPQDKETIAPMVHAGLKASNDPLLSEARFEVDLSDHSDSEAPYEQGNSRAMVQQFGSTPMAQTTNHIELPVQEKEKLLPQGQFRPHSGWPHKSHMDTDQTHELLRGLRSRQSEVTVQLNWV